MKRLDVRLPDDIAQAIQQVAIEHDRSINGEIIQACKAWVAANKKQQAEQQRGVTTNATEV